MIKVVPLKKNDKVAIKLESGKYVDGIFLSDLYVVGGSRKFGFSYLDSISGERRVFEYGKGEFKRVANI